MKHTYMHTKLQVYNDTVPLKDNVALARHFLTYYLKLDMNVSQVRRVAIKG